jgi:uncharacterized protein (DUF433 family)
VATRIYPGAPSRNNFGGSGVETDGCCCSPCLSGTLVGTAEDRCLSASGQCVIWGRTVLIMASTGRIATVRRPYSGIYTVGDAARYLRATVPPDNVPLKMWLARRRPFLGPSSRQLYSWIRHGLSWDGLSDVPRADLVLDFYDLIRLRMIVIMRSRGLPMPVIRRAEDEARHLTGSPQPFVTEPVWTSSSDVFVKLADLLVAASKGGQVAMSFFEEYLTPVVHGISFGPDRMAASWSPSERVLIDPLVQFGSPCVIDTRITTETLWALRDAGDSIETISRSYGIREQDVLAAIRWEETLESAA